MASNIINIETVTVANKSLGDVTKLALSAVQLDTLKNNMVSFVNTYKVKNVPVTPEVTVEPVVEQAIPSISNFNETVSTTPIVTEDVVAPQINNVPPIVEEPVAPVMNPANFADEKVDMSGVMSEPVANPFAESVTPSVVDFNEPVVAEPTVEAPVANEPETNNVLSVFEEYKNKKTAIEEEYHQKISALETEFQNKISTELQILADDKKKIINLQEKATEHLKNAQAAETIANQAFDNARRIA